MPNSMFLAYLEHQTEKYAYNLQSSSYVLPLKAFLRVFQSKKHFSKVCLYGEQLFFTFDFKRKDKLRYFFQKI